MPHPWDAPHCMHGKPGAPRQTSPRCSELGDDMRRLTLVLAIMATAIAPATAFAQSCLGFPSFNDGPIRLSTGASFVKEATGYVAGLAAGVPKGAFFGGGYARVED